MLVPEGTMLMDVGQTMDAIPLLLGGAIKVLRLDQKGDEILLYLLESGDSCTLSMGTYMGNAVAPLPDSQGEGATRFDLEHRTPPSRQRPAHITRCGVTASEATQPA